MSTPADRQPEQPDTDEKTDRIVRNATNFAEQALGQLLAVDGFAIALINREFEVLFVKDPAGIFRDVPAVEGVRDLLAMTPEGLRSRLRSSCEAAMRDNQPVYDNDCTTQVVPFTSSGDSYDLLLISVRPGDNPSNDRVLQVGNTVDSTAAHLMKKQDVSLCVQKDHWSGRNCRLQSMVEDLPIGAVYRENDSLIMNRATEEITGYQRNELDTVDVWFEKLHRENAREVRCIYETARAAGFPAKSEPIPILRKNDVERLIEFSAYKFEDHEVWLMNDATERLHYEAALLERERRLQAIMDNVAEAIVVIDGHGTITEFNLASETLFGYSASEVTGNNVSMLMPPPVSDEQDNLILHALKIGDSRIMNQPQELQGRRKGGSIVPLLLTVSRIDHSDLFCGIMRDLSEQKLFEKEIADISTQEQERIGQEIHDGLGQQLTGLSMMANSLKRDLDRQNLPQANRLEDIIKHLDLAVSEARTLSHGLSPVPVTQHGLADALRILADNIQVATGIDCVFESLYPVDIKDRTNAMQLYRIAQEAVNNAVKHGHAHNIRISMSGGLTSPCELAVSDDGDGFQVDKKTKEGLGLRIMRYRAGIIGCQLDIESSRHKGTVVRCTSTAMLV